MKINDAIKNIQPHNENINVMYNDLPNILLFLIQYVVLFFIINY